MAEFIAEQYFSRTDAAGARRAARAARGAAEQLAREGTDVEFVRSVFVPEDETCIFIFQADSLESVLMAAERGALSFEHIAQAAAEAEDTPESTSDGRRRLTAAPYADGRRSLTAAPYTDGREVPLP